MNNVVVLRGAECEEVVQTAIDKSVPAIMSYLSKGKWHVAKVLLTNLGADGLNVEAISPGKKPRPINIQVDQPVGVSFKYAYGKFVFDTTVAGFEPADSAHGSLSASAGESARSGVPTIILAVPDRIEVVQRRSYFRVSVPESLKVNVTLWHRSKSNSTDDPKAASTGQPSRSYYQSRLVDISAGGAQVLVPNNTKANGYSSTPGEPGFKKGQFVGLRFTPLPYETPLVCNAQIRNILQTEDRTSVYLCMQIVGLEASDEGREVLARLVEVVERYYQINQSSAKQQDMQGTTNIKNSALAMAPVGRRMPDPEETESVTT
jgi:hypothetical protein